LPIRKHRKCHSDICHRGKTLITQYQASREPHDVTSAQLSDQSHLENVDVQRGKICWRFGSRTLNRYRSLISISLVSVWEANFVLFNSMLKFVINRLMHAFFHIRTVIIPRPISTLGLKPSGRYRTIGMITVLIWKRECINL
jgi:hypothetical protein